MYTLLSLIPSHYQPDSWQAILGLFVLCTEASPSTAISSQIWSVPWVDFHSVYARSTSRLIRQSRRIVIQQIWSQARVGRRPILQVIIDLTTWEKRGFQAANGLVGTFHTQRGLHLVVMYLVVGQWRVSRSFRVSARQKHTFNSSDRKLGNLP